ATPPRSSKSSGVPRRSTGPRRLATSAQSETPRPSKSSGGNRHPGPRTSAPTPHMRGNPNHGSYALSLSLYEASIPNYVRMLRNLDALLDKAAAHAKQTGVDLSSYTEAKLAEDMHPLPRQIHLASDAAKGGAARLARIEAPSMPDVEVTFPELKERIAKTLAFLETIKPEQVNGDEERI